jgi:hypothetical protein
MSQLAQLGKLTALGISFEGPFDHSRMVGQRRLSRNGLLGSWPRLSPLHN